MKFTVGILSLIHHATGMQVSVAPNAELEMLENVDSKLPISSIELNLKADETDLLQDVTVEAKDDELEGGRRRRKKNKSKSKTTATAPAPAPSGPWCEEKCFDQGFTCGTCKNKRGEYAGKSNSVCASTWAYPSCAMGCHIGSLSTSVSQCESACDSNNGKCNWNFRGTMITHCSTPDKCPGADRGKSSVEECKVGCRQAFDGSSTNGPRMDPAEVLAHLNEIRAQNGKGPATYKEDKEACANKAATYNAIHGAHKCGIDGVCSDCKFRAAGDFNANDKVDAIDRAYQSRFYEGPADGTCDEQSHCGALLIYNAIAVGHNPDENFYTVYYFD